MKSITITVEAMPGSGIDRTCAEMILLAQETGFPVSTTFNGVYIRALPNSSAKDVIKNYRAEIERRISISTLSNAP